MKLAAEMLNAKILTGKTLNKERKELYDAFKKEEIDIIVVSKAANFIIDLSDANIAIQIEEVARKEFQR